MFSKSPSDSVTALCPPTGIAVKDIRNELEKRFGIESAGGQDQLKGKIFRFGHMGYVDEMDTVLAIAALEQVLYKLGHKFELGAGVGAASLCLAWREREAHVIGVELQPALAALAKENAGLNGLSGRVSFYAGDLLRPPAEVAAGGFDLVLANIFAPELIRLCPLLLRHLAPAGRLVLAGILHDQASEVESAFTAAGLRLLDRPREEEWVSLILEK